MIPTEMFGFICRVASGRACSICVQRQHDIYLLFVLLSTMQTLLTLLARNAKYFHTADIREAGGGSSSADVSLLSAVAMVY